MNQQKAIQNAIARTEELYGQGEWGVSSFEAATAPDGAQGYYIGVMDYSDVNSPIYYFYAGYQFCYEA